MLNISLAQINPTVGDLQGNKKKILKYIAEAKQTNADIVVFPELAICGYPPEDLLYKEHFVQDNKKILSDIVKQVEGIVVIIGFADIDAKKKLYNAAAVIRNKKIIYTYHKEELPNYGVFDEKRYFTSGKNKKIVFKVKGVGIGINICEDLWVDNICKKQAKQGAQIIINISSSPYDVGKLKERQKLLSKTAKETKTFICYANLVGGQDELVFDGNSMAVNPSGIIIAHANHCEEDLLACNLVSNKNAARKITINEKIYKALVLGTHDYIKKDGFKKAVVGLSGGIDSALVTAIAVDAIGKENVIAVSMPSRYSSKGTQSDAKKLAKNLGIEFREIPIESVFNSFNKLLSKEFKGLKSDVTEENIQARIRGMILMALSNKFGWLVLTTGNKSEVAVGYCTLYGDMSGGFAVIKDVPKTMVYELAQYKNKNKEIIPKSILTRAPSAELSANQKDQDSLPEYDLLDGILEEYVAEHRSLAYISKRRNKEMVKKIIKLVDLSEYKRRQAPPGIKITSRAFGKDWRLPITNKYKEF